VTPTGSRTREFPACGEMPQPTAPPRSPLVMGTDHNLIILAYTHVLNCIEICNFEVETRPTIKTYLEKKRSQCPYRKLKSVSVPVKPGVEYRQTLSFGNVVDYRFLSKVSSGYRD
jgi:hypothetical protein